MVAIGLGWSALPRKMMGGDVVEVALHGLAIQRTLGVVQHQKRTLSHAAEALLRVLKAVSHS
jgi:DNA-binding transcriptional LysR family regulator